MNCLKPGHFVKQCKSLHHCKTCQNLTIPCFTSTTQHPLQAGSPAPTPPKPSLNAPVVSSHTASSLTRNSLMMTCVVLVEAPDGSTVKARALLHPASSASFVSERLVTGLCLPHLHQNTMISGIAGLTHNSLQAIANLMISQPLSFLV